MVHDLFSLREPHDNELSTVVDLLASEGFPPVDTLDGITVAANADDELVGFIRVALLEDGYAYIYPIVVFESWRTFGVGRALVQDALRTHTEMKLVSRGHVNDFYESLGFKKIAWEDIDPLIIEECDECELRQECGPQPYKYEKAEQ